MILKQVEGFLNTPSLWDDSLFEVEQFIFPKINLDNFIPKSIPQNIRLGHQIEYLFHQLIVHSQAYEILLFNQPIKNDVRTIGEIDFILKNKQNQELIHVELTYKFYLITTEIPDPMQQFIGPNQKDSFYEKLQKIKNKQFKLLHTHEAINLLKYKNIDAHVVTSKACFKTQLFAPYTQTEIHIHPFKKNCIQGYWLRVTEFNSAAFTTNKFYLPTKQEWVLTPHDGVSWKSFSEITSEIQKQHAHQNAPMVWMKKLGLTFEKFFLVWW